MIPLDAEIYVVAEPIDLRWSFDLLAGRVRDALGHEPRSGALFLFFGRRRDRVKILFHDRTGYCVLYKRLDKGTFHGPSVIEDGQTSVRICDAELELILEGVELPAAEKKPRRRLH